MTDQFSLYLCKMEPETSAMRACLGTLICSDHGYKFRPLSAAHQQSRKWHDDMFKAIPRRFNRDEDFTVLLNRKEFEAAQQVGRA